MFIIGDTLVSLDVLEKEFCCDLDKCHGCCCIEGDAGCPVTDEEVRQIEMMLPVLLPHMTPEAREVVNKQGISYLDPSGELVLSIVNGKDCIFARTDHNGWCYCLIEKLSKNSQFPTLNSQFSIRLQPIVRGFAEIRILNSQFKKPVSCHLYPVRLTQVGNRVGLEYHRWDICHCARVLGKKNHIPLYRFLKEPLIRRFGEEWYNELCLTAEEWKKQCEQK